MFLSSKTAAEMGDRRLQIYQVDGASYSGLSSCSKTAICVVDMTATTATSSS